MMLDKRSAILGVLLALSLLGNFFMAGLLMGQRADAPDNKPAAWREKDAELRRQLSPADKEIIKTAMADTRAKSRELIGQLKADQKDVEEAMHAEPFDQSQLDTALKAESDKKIEIAQLIQNARGAVIAKVSPEGRAILQKMVPPPRPAGNPGAGLPFIWEDDPAPSR